MIFITGDIHGNIDIHKLSIKGFPIQKELTRSDYLIICGDFGLLWNNSDEEKYWLDWLDQKNWTTLWIDGNHENFDMLKDYPVQEWHGGKVQKITENIIHLCRGSIFDIEGKKIFAFGGAESHDKEYRKLGTSLWLEELPSQEEMNLGIENLEKNNWKVDIVITHSLPQSIQDYCFQNMNYRKNQLTLYFDKIAQCLDFKIWFSGHYHISQKLSDKYYLIYNDIVKFSDSPVL